MASFDWFVHAAAHACCSRKVCPPDASGQLSVPDDVAGSVVLKDERLLLLNRQIKNGAEHHNSLGIQTHFLQAELHLRFGLEHTVVRNLFDYHGFFGNGPVNTGDSDGLLCLLQILFGNLQLGQLNLRGFNFVIEQVPSTLLHAAWT